MKSKQSEIYYFKNCRRSITLEDMFNELNKRYFAGALPKYKVMLCSKTRGKYADGALGQCLSNQRKIFLARNLGDETIPTLLHEMIHTKILDHGPSFIREAKRIRTLGANLSQSEIDKVQGHYQKITKRSVYISIQEALIWEQLPREQIPQYLETEFHTPFSKIRKAVNVEQLIREVEKKNT
jgi:hypothetical protein